MALPEGIESDRRLEEVRLAVKSLQELQGKLGDKLQVPRAKAHLQQLSGCVDPHQNPAGYRLCQEELARVGGFDVLLQVAGQTENDLVRSLILEVFAREVFGNSSTASSLLGEHGGAVLAMLRTALSDGAVPERLSALLLAQALAVAEAPPEVLEALAADAAPFMELKGGHGFAQLGEAALDVLTSVSFAHPRAVYGHLGWDRINELLQESQAPTTATEQLQVLVCGLLASNCLAEAADTAAAAEVMASLERGSFFGLYAQCLESAVAREAWPQGSNTFHAPRRLARAAQRLAQLGFRRQLLPAMTLLPKAVEVFSDDTPVEVFPALTALAADVHCLQVLLAQESFRETLEGFHRREDPAATELLSYMELVESALAAGEAAKAAQARENPFAPSVTQLAEIFGAYAALDGKMDPAHLGSTCAAVPIAPLDAVRRSLQSDTSLTLQSFLEHIYGTPTILGWWPSLMEDAAATAAAVPSLPGLPQLATSFEAASGGRSTLPIQELYDVLLPALGIPTEGTVIEVKFAELHGSAPLSFNAFVRWVADLYAQLSAEAASNSGS